MAKQMAYYWTSFARLGTPNAETQQAPVWPAYDPETDNFMGLQVPEPTVTTSFAEDHHSEFWDQFFV